MMIFRVTGVFNSPWDTGGNYTHLSRNISQIMFETCLDMSLAEALNSLMWDCHFNFRSCVLRRFGVFRRGGV